jgi:phage shock protein PspC (stress-responsive transcriptional regulator)
MNKILNINLGGYALTIDDDAYEYLSAYLDSIRKRFKDNEGRDEIVSDIESRLGELITQDMGGRSIVMLPDVEAAVVIMGKPEDFDSEPAEAASDSRRSSGGSAKHSAGSSADGGIFGSGIKTGKRLFRDEDDKAVAGICSGLAAYFGMNDPVWLRLLFVLLTFVSAGFWIPAYFLMWILVPPAKTSADRLAMRGEPINIDNIAKEIEEGFEKLGTKVNEFGTKVNDEFGPGSKKKGFGSGHRAMSEGMSKLGLIFAFMLKFVGKFGIFIAMLVGFALFIALAVSWVGGLFGMISAAPYVSHFSPVSEGATWLAFANTFFVLGIPVIGLVLSFARALLHVRTPGWLRGGLTTLWVLNLISLASIAAVGSRGFRRSGAVTENIDMSDMRGDTLRVEAVTFDRIAGSGDDFWFTRDVVIDGNRIGYDEMVRIRVRRSTNGQFTCTRSIKARGANSAQAIENASQVEFNVVNIGNVLRVPTGFRLEEGRKWRFQEISLTIEVPNGKCVVFDDQITRYSAADIDLYANDDGNYISRRAGKVFQMTDKGLICLDCPKMGDRDYSGDRNYENFIVEGDIKAEIREGNGFSVEIEGSEADRALVQTIAGRNDITFTTNGKTTEGRVKVIIIASTFTKLLADNTGEIVIRGFEEGRASITGKGGSKIKAYLDSQNLNVTLSGKSTLELDGSGNDLKANLIDGAVLGAQRFPRARPRKRRRLCDAGRQQSGAGGRRRKSAKPAGLDFSGNL